MSATTCPFAASSTSPTAFASGGSGAFAPPVFLWDGPTLVFLPNLEVVSFLGASVPILEKTPPLVVVAIVALKASLLDFDLCAEVSLAFCSRSVTLISSTFAPYSVSIFSSREDATEFSCAAFAASISF